MGKTESQETVCKYPEWLEERMREFREWQEQEWADLAAQLENSGKGPARRKRTYQ